MTDNSRQAKLKTPEFIHAVGRRREAIARVRLYPNPKSITWNDRTVNKGDILVNGLPFGQYFVGDAAREELLTPLKLTQTVDKYGITIKIEGGGKSGQLDAAVHGITRALNELNKGAFRATLKDHGLLTRDARVRERRKVGTGGKARRKKQSPKR